MGVFHDDTMNIVKMSTNLFSGPLSSLVAGGLGDTLGIPTTTTAAVHSQIDCENFLIPHQVCNGQMIMAT